MLELNGFDLEEIAEALADQDFYEHRRLIDPRNGGIMFWTADTGIDSATPAPATAPSNGSPTRR